jgi:hypothetical protein
MLIFSERHLRLVLSSAASCSRSRAAVAMSISPATVTTG